ncbi:hypothetical protein [Saccharopolyspora hordei]|uniref:Uncharacterized protein n=1 Tax=Saccharopolyspora hordei TaxID=1838 RepID=A0A853AEK9_9PSEU|nr:hypothetical protein [Saccharopolyspora hordei]NYI82952.1 hypothetical protein [Saccharopolyspora hordei]
MATFVVARGHVDARDTGVGVSSSPLLTTQSFPVLPVGSVDRLRVRGGGQAAPSVGVRGGFRWLAALPAFGVLAGGRAVVDVGVVAAREDVGGDRGWLTDIVRRSSVAEQYRIRSIFFPG